MTDRLKRERLATEQRNIRSADIDTRSIPEILKIINEEDKGVAPAVEKVLPQVEQAVNLTVDSIKNGGRVFYLGAGTSGRLGVLDSSEIPPTFSAPRHIFQGIIAGGEKALTMSIEGAEDRAEDAVRDLKKGGLKSGDVLIGIATSSTTPYVLEGLRYGSSVGSRTVFLICNPAPLVPVDVDVLVAIDVGREVITGSTRMKSGTATKMVLNMISTATMVRLGKVYGNLMVDLKAVSQKLVDRATRIIRLLTSLSYEEAGDLLRQANLETKTAIVMHHKRCSYEEAVRLLDQFDGFLRPIVEGNIKGS
ncbi:MAG: N-acetylmuramic acid 6-phosphate etherase [Fidelibacterota bacterium]